ncbi:histidine phosphatase family protein [Cryptosporidium felis]|nr:histidine phosphatase family protein [Cryptosporidium felis]
MWFFIRHAESANNASNNNDTTDSSEKFNDERVPDPNLTDLGRIQAKTTGAFLSSEECVIWTQEREDQKYMSLSKPVFKTIYCSPMNRSLETAEAIQKEINCPVFVNPDLCEVGGVFKGKRHVQGNTDTKETCNGMGRSEILRKFPNFELDERITEEGWWNRSQESFKEASERASKVAEWLWSISLEGLSIPGTEYQRNTNILITHGLFQDMLMKIILLKRSPLPALEESAIFSCENCAISQIGLYDHEVRANSTSSSSERVCICIRWNSTDHLRISNRSTTRIYPNARRI